MPDHQMNFESILFDAGCSRSVIAHCNCVRDLACRYAEQITLADTTSVEAGAALHDIGRGLTHSIRHAQAGADYCRWLGIPENVARIVECHTGAGLTADECTLLGLLPVDCMPVTLEEKIVANADNLVRGRHTISIWERLNRSYALPGKVRRRIWHLWLEMEQWC
jgi:uncharacterized protein